MIALGARGTTCPHTCVYLAPSGLADQAKPLIVPQCVAHLRATPTAADGEAADGEAAGTASGDKGEVESSLGLLARQLRLATLLLGGSEDAVVAPSIVPASKSARDAAAAAAEGATAASTLPPVLVGEAALRAAETHPEQYDLFYPLERMRFNFARAPSMALVTSALEAIWRCALYGGGGIEGLGLDVPTAEACVVLVLPDLFDRREGAEMLQARARTLSC